MATTYTPNYSLGKQEDHSDRFDMSVITDNMDRLDQVLCDKVDKAEGKQLSTEDFTTAEKEKLSGLKNYDDSELRAELTEAVNSGAKNVLRVTGVTETKNGITQTVNSDGTITYSGTATATVGFVISDYIALDGEYTLTSTPEGGAWRSYCTSLVTQSGSYAYSEYGSGLTRAFTPDEPLQLRAHFASGTNVDGLVYKPMLRRSSITDGTFQPYAPTNRELYEMIAALGGGA